METNTDRLPIVIKTLFKNVLKKAVCTVEFTKVNGDSRTMRCTLKPDLLPTAVLNEDEPVTQRAENPHVVSVWDVDLQAWRGFRWDSVRAFEEWEE